MDPALQRQRLIDQYKAYMSILASKGIESNSVSDEALVNMDLADLARIVRETKDLARTPN